MNLAASVRWFVFLACALGVAPVLAAQEKAEPGMDRLKASPRHHEWVQIKHGGRTLHAFVVFPEVKEKAAAFIVIHENRGLTAWVRSAADRLAEEGYIAIAPDLLSGAAPGGGMTSDFPDTDAAKKAIYALPPDQVTADLDAAADYVSKLPAASGKIAVAGFCWGGGQSFRYATHRPSLSAAFVFYGTGPDDAAAIAKIKAPVYGFYGGNDARIGATLEKTAALMKAAGKTFEPVTYEGAGHGFMGQGEAPDATEGNKKARAEGWKRLLSLAAARLR